MSAPLVVIGILVKLTMAGAGWAILKYRKLWRQESAARLRLHEARIWDNNQRAIDNERWAERVAQGKRHAFERGFKWGQHAGVSMEVALSIEGFDK